MCAHVGEHAEQRAAVEEAHGARHGHDRHLVRGPCRAAFPCGARTPMTRARIAPTRTILPERVVGRERARAPRSRPGRRPAGRAARRPAAGSARAPSGAGEPPGTRWWCRRRRPAGAARSCATVSLPIASGAMRDDLGDAPRDRLGVGERQVPRWTRSRTPPHPWSRSCPAPPRAGWSPGSRTRPSRSGARRRRAPSARSPPRRRS